MPDSSVAITAGTGTNIDTITTPNGDHRQVVFVGDKGGYEGRASTNITPGRAGTAGQTLMTLHNATGSTVAVDLHRVTVDMWQTVIKAVTVPPPVIRLWKFTALPTGGSALSKIAIDSGLTASSSSVTLLQDSSTERTTTGTAISVTRPAGNVLTQEPAPRMITAAGYEPADRIELLSSGLVTLRALEGVAVFLDYTVATSNPVTDMWTVSIHWEEYTP